MGKIAIIFPGQGAQYPGMGKDLYEKSAAARAVFHMADNRAEGTADLCFSGSAEALSITKNTQPALFAVDLACAHALLQNGIKADCTAGFSLGEVVALAYSGMLSDEDAFDFVLERATVMHQVALETDGAMAAILKLSHNVVEDICAEFEQVFPVNYNCPGQITVAGAAKELDKFIMRVSESGGRAIKLAVSGPFHSPFMTKAADQLDADFSALSFSPARIPVYSNVTARPYRNTDRELLFRQIKSPVRWEETIKNMISDGVDTFIEAGPGRVLSGFVKRISRDVRIMNAECYEDILNIKKTLEVADL